MSDFFEMRECVEKALKQKSQEPATQPVSRPYVSRVLQAAAAVVVGAVLGVYQGIEKLEEPVGTVSETYCQGDTVCSSFEILVKG